MSPKTVAPAQSGIADHPCGCGGDKAQACGLDCLERPQFSCGQLLTDQDLTALVEWTRKKAGLARYRHGWGVVCGLDLSIDSSRDGQLLLAPGYAVDCCGNDILVCAEGKVSLAACCKGQESPCEDQAPAAAPGAAAPAEEELEFGGLSLRATNVRAVDLVLHYQEEDGSPRATLGRGGCPTSAREYTRKKEAFRVECVPGVMNRDAAQTEAGRWADGYTKCLEVVRRFGELGPKVGGADIQEWLKRWVDKNPPRQFRFLTDWICGKPAKEWNQKAAAAVLFWLVQDCRNAYLQAGCFSCQVADGVPIGRAWVRMAEGAGGKTTCRVLAVDAQPPNRRPMRSGAWPAPLGHVNVGPAIWRPLNDAAATLSWLGIRLKGAEPFDPGNFENAEALENALNGGLMAAWDSTGKLMSFDAGHFGPRCVGINLGQGK